jgi:mitochondrial-processing peptidase subunit alpha
LGLPKYTPLDNVPRIDATMLRSYMSEYYQPQRMVLAGVGIDHEKLVELGKKYFSVPKSETKVVREEEKAVWTGGAIMVRRLISSN